jgi:hypothetical protein
MDEVLEMVASLPAGAFLAKLDIKDAFRHIPVRQDDWPLLGFKWAGQYYYEKFLPFGLRSSPYLFDMLGSLIEDVLRLHISHLARYVDDFIVAGATFDQCAAQVSKFKHLFHLLNIPLKEDGSDCPNTTKVYLGIEIDTIRQIVRIDNERIAKTQALLAEWASRSFSTKKELEALIGTLAFICRVVKPGRTFLNRFRLTLSALGPKHGRFRHHTDFIDDIHWWSTLLSFWNGTTLLRRTPWTDSESVALSSDASDIGLGGIFGSAWIARVWTPEQKKWSIDARELFAIIVTLHTFGARLRGQKIRFFCDNLPVVQAYWAGRSGSAPIGELLRLLSLTTIHFDFDLTLTHIQGLRNVRADLASRGKFAQLLSLRPAPDRAPTPIPPLPSQTYLLAQVTCTRRV